MTKEIIFRGADACKNDISAIDGEIASVYGLMQGSDGRWTNLPVREWDMDILDGYRIVARHNTPIAQTIILAKGAGVDWEGGASSPRSAGVAELYWTYDGRHNYTSDNVTYIGTVTDILCAAVMDHQIILGTSDGLVSLLCVDGLGRGGPSSQSNAGSRIQYVLIPMDVQAPTLQFGLQRAGMLVTADSVVTKAGAVPATTGSGASQTRPVVTSHYDESVNVSKAIIDSYLTAVKHQATANGYLTQPFMLRYALRMFGGGYLWISQPLMMLPTVLPPRIGVTATADSEGVATISIDLTQNKYFQLRYRVVGDIDPVLSHLVEAVDILVSRPVTTYDPAAVSKGYITQYSQVVSAAGSLGTLRGRRPSRSGTGTFEGHYSEAGDCYVDHMLADMSTHAWFVAPNPLMTDQLLTTDRYYRVASIQYASLRPMSEFAPVMLATADFNALDEHLRVISPDMSGVDWEGGASSPRISGATCVATAMEVYGDTLIVAADSRIMTRPMALGASAPYYGSASDTAATVDVEVYLRHNGQVCKASVAGPGMGVGLSDHVPRYISYPDSDAFMMVLRQGDTTRVLPLTSNEQGTSAYWCDMTADELTVEDIPDYSSGALIHSPGTLYVGRPFRLSRAIRLGATVLALSAAMRAARSGQFGQYPLYAFTVNGVYMLRIDDASRSVTAARQISSEACTGSHVAADGEGRVYYATAGHIREIDGSECSTLTDALMASPIDVADLPHAAEVLERHGLRQVECMSEDLFEDPRLVYDRLRRLLWTYTRDVTMVYGVDSGVWAVAGEAAHLGIWRGAMISRVIKVDHPVDGHTLRRVEVIGRISPRQTKIMLYGSNDLTHWHLTAAVEGSVVPLCDSTPYRYWRMLILTELSDDGWIAGVTIT